MTDPLDIPISSTPATPRPFRGPASGSDLLTGEDFFPLLNSSPRTTLWVMTFTASERCPCYLTVERLLTAIGDFRAATETRRLVSIHTKLYLQFLGDDLVAAYLGSQNFVAPTTDNLMIVVPRDHHLWLKEYFEHYWKQAIYDIRRTTAASGGMVPPKLPEQ